MLYEGTKGKDIRIEADNHVILRIQGHQWRIKKPPDGIAVLSGNWTRNLVFPGGKPIQGDVWVGKTKHRIKIDSRG